MIINLSKKAKDMADIAHRIDIDAITFYPAGTFSNALPYVPSLPDFKALKPFIFELAVSGGDGLKPCFTGKIAGKTCNFDDVVKRVEFFIIVEDNPKDVPHTLPLEIRITPTQGARHGYRIPTTVTGAEVRTVKTCLTKEQKRYNPEPVVKYVYVS